MGISTMVTLISWISLSFWCSLSLLVLNSFSLWDSLWFSISSSLVISMSMGMVINNMGIMTNNLGTMVSLNMSLVTLLMDDILALLNVGGINNGLALLSWNLSLMLLRNLVTLVFHMVLAVRSR